MADNVAITAGTGTTIAADDIGGVLHQRVKISQGADGSATDVSSAAPLQVSLANTAANTNKLLVTPDLPTGAATAAKQPALGTAGSASTDVITVQGIASGTVIPISVATIPSHAVTNAGTFATQVTSIAAGNNNIGDVDVASLPALVAGTANIGDVDVLTINGVAPAFGSGANGATVLRTALATDSPGIITVGTAGSASSQVVTVQGVSSMTPVLATLSGTNTVATVTAVTGGGVAHDGADSGNPLKVGGRARSSEIAAVASDDRSDFITDLVGKQIVIPYANPENFVSGCISSAMTGTTSTSLIAAPASGLRNYITQITASCAHATQGTDILIQDGSGGTTLYVIPAAALYGGAVVTFPTPLRQPTTATAIFCANVTTGSSTKVSASGYKGA